MSELEIPKRASLDDIKDILKAYYLVGAHTEAVSTKEVEDTAQLGDKVGRQTKFLLALGLLSREGRKRRLTEDGESIAEALMAGNESLSKSLMRETLNEWKFTDKITGFVRMQEPQPVEENRLREFISANAGSSDSRGQKALLELLRWANILDAGEDGYVISNSSAEEVQQEDLENEQSSEAKEQVSGRKELEETDVQGSTESLQLPSSSVKTEGFGLNIEVSGSDDPENVEKVITAVRRALQKDLSED